MTPQEVMIRLSRESQARTKTLLANGATTRAGSDAARGAFAYSDEQVRHLRIMQPGPMPACTIGCSHCCYGGCVAVTVPEAIAIAEHIHSLEDEAVKAGVLARLQSQAELVNTHGSVAAWGPRLACPLLDEKSGTCIVYNSRPLKCRGWASFDAEACRTSKEVGGDADPSIPRDPVQGLVTDAVQIGQMKGLAEAGVDGTKYELVTAVDAAIRTPDAIEKWTTGNGIPAARPTPPGSPNKSKRETITAPSERRAKNEAKRNRKKLRRR